MLFKPILLLFFIYSGFSKPVWFSLEHRSVNMKVNEDRAVKLQKGNLKTMKVSLKEEQTEI